MGLLQFNVAGDYNHDDDDDYDDDVVNYDDD